MAKRAFFRIVAKTRSGDAALVSHAGRFNSPHSPPTCYVADELQTAWAEVAARFGTTPPDGRLFAGLRVGLDESRLFDLDSLEKGAELLLDPAPPEAWSFADRLREESEYIGIVYRSVRRPGHRCVVLFLEKIADLTVEPSSESEFVGAVLGGQIDQG
jgi:RES domain-containing protein